MEHEGNAGAQPAGAQPSEGFTHDAASEDVRVPNGGIKAKTASHSSRSCCPEGK